MTIAWQVPLAKTETYRLEVARDPGFGDIVHTGELAGAVAATYAWDAPAEGVYHWRLARSRLPAADAASGSAGDSSAAEEVITFVSGSFAVVDPGAPRERPARLTWQPEPGADRYKLYVVDESGAARTMISTAPSFVVPGTDRALMIEVVPFSGSQRLFRHYHYNPTLAFDPGTPPPPPPPSQEPQPAPEPVAAAAPAPVEPPPPAAEAAAPTESTEATEATEAVEMRRPRPRVHMVHVFGFAGSERLRLQKLEVDLGNEGRVQGGGAGVWTNPVAGLVVGAQGAYHEHTAVLRQESLLPGVETRLDAARYSVDFAIGWDVLSSLASRWHRLVFSLGAAGTQLPYLPLEYSSTAGTAPDLGKKATTLLGGSAAYGYFGDQVAAVLEGGVFQDDTDAASMAFQRLLVEVYVGERVAIQLGGFHRSTTGARCHSDRNTCLVEGKSRVTAEEVGGFLGLANVFR